MCSSMSVKCVHQPHSSSFFVPLSRVVTQFFLFLYCKLLWRGLKFVTRKFTGRCELQRICYNNKHGARRTLKIGRSASTFCHQSSFSSSFTFLWQYGHILTNELRLLILFYFPLKTLKNKQTESSLRYSRNEVRALNCVRVYWNPPTDVSHFRLHCLNLFALAVCSCCSRPWASTLRKWRRPSMTSWLWRGSTPTPTHSETHSLSLHVAALTLRGEALWPIKLFWVSTLYRGEKTWMLNQRSNTDRLK